MEQVLCIKEITNWISLHFLSVFFFSFLALVSVAFVVQCEIVNIERYAKDTLNIFAHYFNLNFFYSHRVVFWYTFTAGGPLAHSPFLFAVFFSARFISMMQITVADNEILSHFVCSSVQSWCSRQSFVHSFIEMQTSCMRQRKQKNKRTKVFMSLLWATQNVVTFQRNFL